jgi:hypothetical protein
MRFMKMIRNVQGILKMLSLLIVVALLGMACSKSNGYNNSTPSNSGNYTISGSASGSNMVPPVSGNGSATISGTYNANTHMLNYTANWSGLSGAPTNGGFFYAAMGSNGSAIGTPWTFDSTAIAKSMVSGQMTLTAEQAQWLTSGNWYYTIGTAANPGGEVRSQISAKPQ